VQLFQKSKFTAVFSRTTNFTKWLICFVISLRYHLSSGKLLADAIQRSLFTKSVIFKIATLAAFIAWHASAATTHGAEVDRRTDRWLSLNEPSSKVPLIFAWGEHTESRTIETQTMFIRHTATELQRRIAEKNAKAYYAQLAPEKKDELKKKKIHYLAVPTVRSKETSPKAKEVLMIWDIPRESLVGQNVYELDKKPPLGTLASYDNLRAEYIGTVAGNP
jgi:hypothetical protein